MAATAKSKKQQAQPTAKSNRPTVVSFRITEDQTEKLGKVFDQDAPVGVRSTNQYARKVMSDFLAGRLTYKNVADRKKDLDLYGK